jgi:hypothetical protein
LRNFEGCGQPQPFIFAYASNENASGINRWRFNLRAFPAKMRSGFA